MIFAKIDAGLDAHPKVRRAGRDGREVFLFLLRKNAMADFNGRIPSSHLDPWYLADQLMMSEEEARNGLSRAVTAGLIVESEGHCVILGWDDEWAKRPLTNLERQHRFRAKTHNQRVLDVESVVCNEASVTVNEVNEINGSEESREDKKKKVRAPRSAPPDVCFELADVLRDLVLAEQPTNALANKPWPPVRAKWAQEFAEAISKDRRTPEAMGAMLRWVFHGQTGHARYVVRAPAKLRQKYDDIELRMRQSPSSNGEQLPLTVNLENYQ